MKDPEARIIRLEERYTHLQHHVTEQDKIVLELAQTLERMRQEIARLQAAGTTPRTAGEDMPADERPPHY